MKLSNNIVFSYLDIPPLVSSNLINFFENISDDDWFFDTYRTAFMLPIYTEGGKTSKVGSLNLGSSPLNWTRFATTELKSYLENFIFSWMLPRGRVMVLKTFSGHSSSPHIDCRKEDFSCFQPKLRIVLQGDVTSLFFITKNGDIRPDVSELGRPFVMDGRWPHGMKNNSLRNKYTICIGTPWAGEGLNLCNYIEGRTQLKANDLDLPMDYDRYFEDLNKRKKKFET